MELEGKKIRLNTQREGMFWDDLSGINLDKWDNGTSCVVPKEIPDDKLRNIEVALKVGILFLEDDIPESIHKLDKEREALAAILNGNVDMASFGIKKIDDMKSLDYLETLEKSGSGRKGVLTTIKERREKLASSSISARRESGNYQVTNIKEQ